MTIGAAHYRRRQAALPDIPAGPESEAELRAEIANALRRMGWHVVDTSQDRPARGGLCGFPDLIAFRIGRTLLIETKHGKEKLNAGQQVFAARVATHLDPRSLLYCVARSLDDVRATLGLS